MSQPFLGQIMPAAFNFAPRGFAGCNGSLMSISQNQALFSLLGTYYGGNGTTTFALPDLRGRTPIGFEGNAIAEAGGTESVTLLQNQLPAHTHSFNGSTNPGGAYDPSSGVFGGSGSLKIYGSSGGQQVALAATIDNAGQTQPHSNMQPYTVLNFCIALNGVFPSRG